MKSHCPDEITPDPPFTERHEDATRPATKNAATQPATGTRQESSTAESGAKKTPILQIFIAGKHQGNATVESAATTNAAR